MSGYDDDDDWVGTPPEGHHSRDRADPEFWWKQRFLSVGAGGLALVILVLIVIVLVR